MYLYPVPKDTMKQSIDLQDRLENCCNVLPQFSSNIANFDLNIIKSFLLPIIVSGRDTESTIVRKADKFNFFKLGEVQFLHTMIFLLEQQIWIPS